MHPRRPIRTALTMALLALGAIAIAACGKSASTDQKLKKIADDKSLSDKAALTKMAKEVLSGSGHPLTFKTLPDGTHHLMIQYRSSSSSRTAAKSGEQMKRMMSKYFAQVTRWMFLHGRKRKLGKLTFQYNIVAQINGAERALPAFVFSFTRANADALKSWKESAALAQIKKTWKVEVDNFSKLRVGR